jgi:hypothetical protein
MKMPICNALPVLANIQTLPDGFILHKFMLALFIPVAKLDGVRQKTTGQISYYKKRQ